MVVLKFIYFGNIIPADSDGNLHRNSLITIKNKIEMKKLLIAMFVLIIVNIQAQTYSGKEKSNGETIKEQPGGGVDKVKENTNKTKVKGTTGTPSRDVKDKDLGNTNRPIQAAGDVRESLERNPKGSKENTLGSDKFCAKLWNHLNNWKGEEGERPGAKLELEWFEHNSADLPKDFVPGKKIEGPQPPLNLDDKSTDGQSADINIPLKAAEEIEGLRETEKGVLKADDGSFIVSNKKGRVLTAISFQEPNKKGEIWGVSKVKDKFFAVKFSWKRAKLDSRNKLVLLE